MAPKYETRQRHLGYLKIRRQLPWIQVQQIRNRVPMKTQTVHLFKWQGGLNWGGHYYTCRKLCHTTLISRCKPPCLLVLTRVDLLKSFH